MDGDKGDQDMITSSSPEQVLEDIHAGGRVNCPLYMFLIVHEASCAPLELNCCHHQQGHESTSVKEENENI